MADILSVYAQDDLFKGATFSNRMPSNVEQVASRQSSVSSNQQKGEGRTQRMDLQGGGYRIMTWNDDGSLDTQDVTPCFGCHGNKICRACAGRGGTYRAYINIYYPCNMCLQTGKCSVCKGSGTITTKSHTDKNGYGTVQSSTGSVAVGGPEGTIVTSPNGRVTAHPKGERSSRNSDSSRSSSGVCSRCNGRRYNSEPLQYAPASAHGWAQPYHNTVGSTCPYCSSVAEHYHSECTECRGFGHK